MQIRISKPIVVDGKLLSKSVPVPVDGEKGETVNIDVIDLDLDALTGDDMRKCVRLASMAKGSSVKVLVTDEEFHLQVAARASGIDAEILNKLPAPDWVEVVTTVQGFLTRSI
jgi:hypothetical protein